MKKELTFTLIFLIIFLVLISLLLTFSKNIKDTSKFTDRLVTNVIDGDTFQYYNAETYTYEIVRLLCIDTPEKGEEGYEEAKTFLESLILGKQVTLNASVTNKDSYGRLLRYVYLGDTFVNKEMLDNGYASLMIIPPEECKELIQ